MPGKGLAQEKHVPILITQVIRQETGLGGEGYF